MLYLYIYQFMYFNEFMACFWYALLVCTKALINIERGRANYKRLMASNSVCGFPPLTGTNNMFSNFDMPVYQYYMDKFATFIWQHILRYTNKIILN